MAAKRVIQFSVMTGSILMAGLLFALSTSGFEYRITPEELRSQINATLPLDLEFQAQAELDLNNIGGQVQADECKSAPGTTSIGCKVGNLLRHPVRRAFLLLVVVLDKHLEKVSNIVSTDGKLDRVGDLYIDSEGNIHTKGYISVSSFPSVEFPVDAVMITEINQSGGVIELKTKVPGEVQEKIDRWKVVIDKELPHGRLPLTLSDFDFSAEDPQINLNENYSYTLDLDDGFWFSLFQPLLRDIEINQRGIILKYGL